MKKFLALLLAAIMLLSVTACGKKEKEKETFDWSLLELHNMLPEPSSNVGYVWEDNDETLRVDVEKVTEADYKAYVSACKERGFTIDSEKGDSRYDAYDTNGYHLHVDIIGSRMSIELEAPMKMTAFTWPKAGPGALLPAPESNIGKVDYHSENCFMIYVGNTTIEQFNAYIDKCAEKGFSVDYNRGDKYYYADNAEGYHISLSYEGSSIMSVRIEAPDKETPAPTDTPEPATDTPEPVTDTPEPVTDTPEPVTEPTTEPVKTEEPSELVDGMRPEVKDAIDKYEAFIDEYCAFMKKYTDEGNPITMLADYTEMVIQLTEMAAAFSELGEQDLNDAELAYFLEVQLRVNQKLLDLEVYISEHSGNG